MALSVKRLRPLEHCPLETRPFPNRTFELHVSARVFRPTRREAQPWTVCPPTEKKLNETGGQVLQPHILIAEFKEKDG